MATLDWSQCPAVESIPGKRGGAWVFQGTRTPVATVFENLQDMSVDALVEEFGVTREQVQDVLQFAAHSTESAAPSRYLEPSARNHRCCRLYLGATSGSPISPSSSGVF